MTTKGDTLRWKKNVSQKCLSQLTGGYVMWWLPWLRRGSSEMRRQSGKGRMAALSVFLCFICFLCFFVVHVVFRNHTSCIGWVKYLTDHTKKVVHLKLNCLMFVLIFKIFSVTSPGVFFDNFQFFLTSLSCVLIYFCPCLLKMKNGGAGRLSLALMDFWDSSIN